jgi:hypothetical protein
MNAIHKTFRAVDAVDASFIRFSSPLGPRVTFHSNAAQSHHRDYVPWEGVDQSPRVAFIPKRNLNDLPFVSINFRKGYSSCFSRRTHILLSEGDTLG